MVSFLYFSKEDLLLFLALTTSIWAGSLAKIPTPNNPIQKDIKKITPSKNELLSLPLTKRSTKQRWHPKYKRAQTSHEKQRHSMIMKQVAEYYRCINKTQTQTRNIYKALVVKVGQTLVLKCHQCFQPGMPNEKRKQVKWKQLRQDGAIISNIQPDNNYQLTPNRDLKIREISLEDTGQFFCLGNNEYKAVYQVDVHRQLDYRIIEKNSSLLLAKEHLPENNLELFSSWTSWTKCSQCALVHFHDLPDRCRRDVTDIWRVNYESIENFTTITNYDDIVTCTYSSQPGVKSANWQDPAPISHTHEAVAIKRKNSKIFKDKPVKPIDIPAFYLFDGGVPCRSSVVPKSIAQLLPIAKRQSEILVLPCAPPCPTTPDEMTIKDKQGNIIYAIQPGYYSIHDKPELAATIKRKVLYEMEGKRVLLKCPTTERMIRWQNGTEALNFMTLRKKSKGRIFIDGNNWLHIKKITLADSAIYSCWKQDRLLSTIKLKVTKVYGNVLGPYITYTLAVILVGCVPWALYNIYRGPQNRVAY